jgi:GDPmannose 4,6-dehydratase
MKIALIAGITGQDESYLAELLLSKGYEIPRESTTYTLILKLRARLFLRYGDVSDAEQVSDIVYNIRPNEICHMAPQ